MKIRRLEREIEGLKKALSDPDMRQEQHEYAQFQLKEKEKELEAIKKEGQK